MAVSSVVEQLKKLVTAGIPVNPWLECDELAMYVRVAAHHVLPGCGMIKCVDIANVTVAVKGNKTYTHLLDQIEPIILDAGFAIYIENVIEERLFDFYIRRGYTKLVNRFSSEWPPSFYKVKD